MLCPSVGPWIMRKRALKMQRVVVCARGCVCVVVVCRKFVVVGVLCRCGCVVSLWVCGVVGVCCRRGCVVSLCVCYGELDCVV